MTETRSSRPSGPDSSSRPSGPDSSSRPSGPDSSSRPSGPGFGELLLKVARGAIEAALGGPAVVKPADPRLDQPGACFVSLKQGDALRGCIGNLQASPRVFDAVVSNAQSSALRDPRFQPLRREELARTRIEISLMSPMRSVPASTREELMAQLQPGVHGLVLSAGTRSAVFIPAVWEQLADKDEFVDHLLAKGGFAYGRWPANMRAEVFTADLFEEEDPT